MTLTNVLAQIVITLLTNTVESDNGVKGCGHLPPEDHKGGIFMSLLHLHEGYPESCTQEKKATEKTVTTTVTERTEATIYIPSEPVVHDMKHGEQWFGERPMVLTKDRELSRTVKRYVKSQEWVEVKPPEIETPLTNHIVWPSKGRIAIRNFSSAITNELFTTNELRRLRDLIREMN